MDLTFLLYGVTQEMRDDSNVKMNSSENSDSGVKQRLLIQSNFHPIINKRNRPKDTCFTKFDTSVSLCISS